MTIWNPNVSPTPENVRRRLFAAIDALDAADVLIVRTPKQKGLAETRTARAWATKAIDKLGGTTDARGRVH